MGEHPIRRWPFVALDLVTVTGWILYGCLFGVYSPAFYGVIPSGQWRLFDVLLAGAGGCFLGLFWKERANGYAFRHAIGTGTSAPSIVLLGAGLGFCIGGATALVMQIAYLGLLQDLGRPIPDIADVGMVQGLLWGALWGLWNGQLAWVATAIATRGMERPKGS
jgi:hypothetical protein